MERKYPGPDTGKRELQRIINCMKENKYEYDESLYAGKYEGYYKLNFVKQINYSDIEGTNINDRRIKVTIEFDTSFDYETEYKKNIDGDFFYDDNTNANKAYKFIKQIIDNTCKE